VSQPVTVRVNGAARTVSAETTVAALVAELGRRPEGTAVAVNLEVVSHGRWADTVLSDGDRVEILCAAPGG
jgi:sulfur carrier protein